MADLTLGGFASMLQKASEELDDHLHEALDRVAEHIERDAKGRIGHYNGAVGPFAAWAPLAPSTVQDRASKGYAPDEPLLRTGDLRESIGKEVRQDEATIGSDSEVAVAQELGTSKIPPRSFLGAAGAAAIPMIQAEFGMAIVTAVKGAKV
jgi:phage gpG-like protein